MNYELLRSAIWFICAELETETSLETRLYWRARLRGMASVLQLCYDREASDLFNLIDSLIIATLHKAS